MWQSICIKQRYIINIYTHTHYNTTLHQSSIFFNLHSFFFSCFTVCLKPNSLFFFFQQSLHSPLSTQHIFTNISLLYKFHYICSNIKSLSFPWLRFLIQNLYQIFKPTSQRNQPNLIINKQNKGRTLFGSTLVSISMPFCNFQKDTHRKEKKK